MYARRAEEHGYDSDAEADDEYERSIVASPEQPMNSEDEMSDPPYDSEEEEDEHESVEGANTPTTQGWGERGGRSPMGKISQWTEEEVADYISSLSPSLTQYGQSFVDEGINGEALIALHHDELREVGVTSVGHRLTILKAVYEQKIRSGVKVEEGDYVPPSAEHEKGDMTVTQDDIARIIDSIRLRDQRIIAAESELRVLKHDLERISEDNKKLREETLPIMRLMKDQRTPLPDPSGGTLPSPREVDPSKQSENMANHAKASSLSRKFSTKKLILGNAPKQASPTYPPQAHTPGQREVRDDSGAQLEASAAAMAASNHLTASMSSQMSPNSIQGQQLSPTSPAYSVQGPGSAGLHPSAGSATARSVPRNYDQRSYAHGDETGTSYSQNSSHWSQASTVVGSQGSARPMDKVGRQGGPVPSPRDDEPPRSAREGSSRDKDNPQVEIFKTFRVSIEDPCRVVLPVALKRYNIVDDWRQYSLYIVHGDQERCLGLEEKPLLMFKQLDKEGRKPMFMLRRHQAPQEGWVSHTGGGGGGGGGAGAAQEPAKQIPGGVL